MNRILRTSMVVALLFTMCFSCFAVSAEENDGGFEFAADCAEAVNAGETFDVTVKASRNDGITALRFYVEYDESVLTLNGVTDEKLFEGATLKDTATSPFLYVWADGTATENNTATGDIITLSFTVKENVTDVASTCIKIGTAGANDILNSDLVPVYTNVLELNVGVVAADPVVLGDLTGDDTVAPADAVYLMYYCLNGDAEYPLNQACDFNNDGNVDSDDAVYLLYHVLYGEEYPLIAE